MEFAGQSHIEKLNNIKQKLQDEKADVLVVSALDEIACKIIYSLWLLDILPFLFFSFVLFVALSILIYLVIIIYLSHRSFV